MRKFIVGIVAAFCLPMAAHAQELFAFTEPASNMPARSIGLRLSNWVTANRIDHSTGTNAIPEVMWGVNRNLMLHADGFFGNSERRLKAEGFGVYGKYRLYTVDGVYTHFRLAAFGRWTTNNSVIQQEEIDLNGHNSGYQAGLIATQLLHKQAISSSVSFAHATNNGGGHLFPGGISDNAINASLSTGRLLLPTNYKRYGQTNLNIMAELLVQHLTGSDKTYVDIAPVVQLIFNSQIRLDVGYKRELYSNMERAYPNGLMVRFEYLFFNAL